MDYFVSAEDTVYHHWQLELLIESFQLHNLTNHLVIGMAYNDDPKYADFTTNLRKFKRIFIHESVGRKRGCLHMNRPYALLAAIDQQLVQQPFTLIDPDMTLVLPILPKTENVVFQLNPLLNPMPAIQDIIKDICQIRKLENCNYWIPLGNVMVFQNTPREFFLRTVEWIEKLEFLRLKKYPSQSWTTEKFAWILTLLEYHGHLLYQSTYDLEMHLLDNNLTRHFIHYQHGLPPVFSKYHYRFTEPFAMGNLFETLLQHNPTTTTNYFQQIVKSYTKKIQPTTPLNHIIQEITA